MGVPPNHPFEIGIFPYKPASYCGTPHDYGNPHCVWILMELDLDLRFQCTSHIITPALQVET